MRHLDQPPTPPRMPVAGSAVHRLLGATLRRAMELTGTTRGTLQLRAPATQELSIVLHTGFDRAFLDHFSVADEHAACGQAAAQARQVVIADVRHDESFAPHRQVAATSGFRAVQSTPLVDGRRQAAGIVSTHFDRSHRPSDEVLDELSLLGALVGRAVEAAGVGRSGDGADEAHGVEPASAGPESVRRMSRSVVELLESGDPVPVERRSWVGRDDLHDDGSALILLAAENAELRSAVSDLQRALDSRVVIEQAKGVIAARDGVNVEEAFLRLRRHARRHNARIHDVARAVVELDLIF